jgi:hypothetical protein
VGIAAAISKGCGWVENSFIVFHAFHRPSFPRPETRLSRHSCPARPGLLRVPQAPDNVAALHRAFEMLKANELASTLSSLVSTTRVISLSRKTTSSLEKPRPVIMSHDRVAVESGRKFIVMLPASPANSSGMTGEGSPCLCLSCVRFAHGDGWRPLDASV